MTFGNCLITQITSALPVPTSCGHACGSVESEGGQPVDNRWTAHAALSSVHRRDTATPHPSTTDVHAENAADQHRHRLSPTSTDAMPPARLTCTDTPVNFSRPLPLGKTTSAPRDPCHLDCNSCAQATIAPNRNRPTGPSPATARHRIPGIRRTASTPRASHVAGFRPGSKRSCVIRLLGRGSQPRSVVRRPGGCQS